MEISIERSLKQRFQIFSDRTDATADQNGTSTLVCLRKEK